MQQLIPIGQFAALTRLSLKALRLYDENGLLPPAAVDPTTGYRSYRLEQVYHAQIIRLLRAVDMPLAEIKAFLQLPEAACETGWTSTCRCSRPGSASGSASSSTCAASSTPRPQVQRTVATRSG